MSEQRPRPILALDSPVAAAVAFVVFTALLSLPGLGSSPLVRMEGMIVAIAQEMLASGDYLISRLYGEIYTYKPPLLYWLVAGSIELTGSSSEWTIRLPVALSGLILGLGTLWSVGSIAGSRVGWIAAVASSTGALALQKLRIAEFDAPLAALVGIAVAAACHAFASDDEASKWPWLICYPALAAAVLVKGVPALMIFLPGLAVAAVASGRVRELGRWPHLLGVTLCGALSGLYLVQAHSAAGWQAFIQPLEEARLRGGDWTLAAAGRTLLKPLLIVGYFLPWSVVLFWARPEGVASPRSRLVRSAWGFLVAGTLAFMAVPTHESRYYLPLAVPVGILAALGLETMAGSSRRLARIVPAALAGAGGLLAIGLGAVPASPAPSVAGRGLLVGLGVVALTIAAGRFRHGRFGHPLHALLVTALCFWSAETLAFGPGRASSRDQRPAAAELAPSLAPDETIWVPSPAGLAGNYSALLHYLGHPVLTFDGAQGPPAGAACVMREADLTRVEPAVLERMRVIAEATGPRWTYRVYRYEP